ncbi:hypothetical protein Ancab_030883 [Ancistrocladus abbreviatus]
MRLFEMYIDCGNYCMYLFCCSCQWMLCVTVWNSIISSEVVFSCLVAEVDHVKAEFILVVFVGFMLLSFTLNLFVCSSLICSSISSIVLEPVHVILLCVNSL